MLRTFLLSLALALCLALAATRAQAQVGVDEPDAINVACAFCAVAVAPDGDLVAVYEMSAAWASEGPPESGQGAIQLVSLDDVEPFAALDAGTDWVADAAFSPDGSQLAASYANGDLLIWDVAAQEVAHELIGAVGGGSLAWLADGERLAQLVPAMPSEVHIFEVESGAIVQRVRFALGSYSEISAAFDDSPYGQFNLRWCGMAITPDESRLFTSTQNGTVGVWDLATGDYDQIDADTERQGMFSVCSLHVSADGSLAAWADTRTEILFLWDVERGRRLVRGGIEGLADIRAIGLSDDGAQVVWVTSEEPALYLAATDALIEDGVDAAAVIPLDLPEGLRVAPRGMELVFLPDGETLLVGGFANPAGESLLLRVPITE